MIVYKLKTYSVAIQNTTNRKRATYSKQHLNITTNHVSDLVNTLKTSKKRVTFFILVYKLFYFFS